MRRREFITLLGGATAICPTPLRAQQSGKLRTVGLLATGSGAAWGEWMAAFVRRLRELGWIEGSTVAIDIRWASGQNERISEIAAEFVARSVDLIVTSGLAVPATRQMTSTIPIVFAIANEPVSTGLVANLARPGGNVTGLSLQAPEVAPKRVEILREIVPHLHRLAILTNVNYPAAMLEMDVVQGIGRTLGLEIILFRIERAAELSSVFEGLNSRADALYVCPDPLAQTNRVRISTMAVAARLPTMNGSREYVEVGGLVSYGPNFPDLFRRAAEYADKILRGTKPGDLPVEQPTRFDLVINLTTAKALGIEVPPTMLARADEVIE